eukprot:5505337-Amphidinium_carterae.1
MVWLSENCVRVPLVLLLIRLREFCDAATARLAMLLAACAGTSSDDIERRQWMRLQVARWRAEGVHELMGSALWRIREPP